MPRGPESNPIDGEHRADVRAIVGLGTSPASWDRRVGLSLTCGP
jgi:hypothetical protein